MQYAETLLKNLRGLIHAEEWDGWHQNLPKLQASGRRDKRWRVSSGDVRYDPAKKNALFAKPTRIALNFQVVGVEQEATEYEFCLAWPDGWQLMYHWDKKRTAWPDHPEHHVQFEAPSGDTPISLPPFVSWRLPFAEAEPERLFEYLTKRALEAKL